MCVCLALSKEKRWVFKGYNLIPQIWSLPYGSVVIIATFTCLNLFSFLKKVAKTYVTLIICQSCHILSNLIFVTVAIVKIGILRHRVIH